MADSVNKAAKAGTAYTIGNVLLKGITFLTLPIFSRILTTEEFGYYNLYVSYETILTIFVGLCLYGSLRTGKYDYAKNFEQYVTSALSLSLIPFLAILFVGNIAYPLLSPFFEFSQIVLNILVIHSYAMFIFQFYNTKLALEFRYKEFLLASAANSIGGTLLSMYLIIFVFEQNKHIARICGYAIVPIVVAAGIWFGFLEKAVRRKHTLFNIEHWKYGLGISLPLVVHTFSQQILNQFDRIMISKMVSKTAVGVYGFIHTISNILQIIVQSMDTAWSVWFYEQLNQKNYENIKEKSAAYVLLMNVIYVGFVSLAPDVIHIAGTSDYYEGTSIIVPLAFSVYFTFLYSLPVHIEYFYKKTKYIALGTSMAATANFIMNYIFISLFGYKASAWTTMVSYILLFVFHWVISKRIDSKSMFATRMIVGSTISLGIYSILIFSNIEKVLLRWIIMVTFLGGMLYYYRKIVLTVLQTLPFIKKESKRNWDE